jgi:hypothetical protein
MFTLIAITNSPLTVDVQAWYATVGYVALGSVAAVLIVGWRSSLALAH